MASAPFSFETVSSPPADTTATASFGFETTPAPNETTANAGFSFTTGTGPAYTTATAGFAFTTATAGGVYRWDGDRWVRQWVYRRGPSNWVPLSYGAPDPVPPAETVPGFERIATITFPTDVAEGGFPNVSSGSDLGAVDPASPGGIAYGHLFKTAQDESLTSDTTGARYSSKRTMSVQGGILTIHGRVIGGIPYGSKFKPWLTGMPDVNNMTYGRYVVCMRKSANDTTGGGVFDLINNNTWPNGTGEIGLFEGNGKTSRPGVWIRPSNGLPNPNNYKFFRAAEDYGVYGDVQGWHIGEIRSQPGRVQVIVDGVVIYDDTTFPPSTPLGFVYQSGFPEVPTVSSWFKQEIKWCTISKWVGV